MAVLRRLSADLDADRTSVPQMRDVMPPPVLCPSADSPVRFLPLIDKAPPAGAPDRKRWRFVNLAAFEGVDFAYAVCRSLLHRLPTKREIAAADSTEGRFLLLLAADFEARRTNGPGRLAGLGSAKRLYRMLRTLETLRLRPLASAVCRMIDARARRMFAKRRDRIAARRQRLAVLTMKQQR